MGERKKLFNFVSAIGFCSVFTFLSACSPLTNRTFIEEMEGRDADYFVPGIHFPVVSGDRGRTYRSHEEIRARTPASAFEAQRSRYETSIERELMLRENRLNERELRQYEAHSQYLSRIEERIYYLDLSPHERAEYIRLKGFNPSVYAAHQRTRSNSTMRAPASQNFARTNQELAAARPSTFQEGDKDFMGYAALKSSSSQRELSSGSGDPGRSPALSSRADDEMRMSITEARSHNDRPISLGMGQKHVAELWGEPNQIRYAGNSSAGNEKWLYYRAGKVRKVYFEQGRVDGWKLD